MSTQYRLVQSGKTASGGCSAGPRFLRAYSATDLFFFILNYELERIWKEAVAVSFKVLSLHLPGGAEENH
jgi:hypothetical protein